MWSREIKKGARFPLLNWEGSWFHWDQRERRKKGLCHWCLRQQLIRATLWWWNLRNVSSRKKEEICIDREQKHFPCFSSQSNFFISVRVRGSHWTTHLAPHWVAALLELKTYFGCYFEKWTVWGIEILLPSSTSNKVVFHSREWNKSHSDSNCLFWTMEWKQAHWAKFQNQLAALIRETSEEKRKPAVLG